MPLEGLQLGRYQLLRLLGSGGMGEVYLATDTRINRQVAIKVIRDEVAAYPNAQATQEVARLFQREMKAITVLDHPHILPLYDFGEEIINRSTLTYMVMPFRQEGSLADWLQQRSNSDMLSPEDVSYFINQAAEALQHAHDHHLIHQDVKPSNFLIRSRAGHPNRPDLLLADFGIAKFTTATATASQSIRGTPAYMAPEQWDGQPVPATDQYALAIMAYQLLTGRPPFIGGPGQVMRQHFTAQPQPPSTLNPRIPHALDAVILRALAKQAEDRFLSIAEFAADFQQVLAGRPQGIAPAQPSGNDIQGRPQGIAPTQPSGNDIRATLAISQAEAQNGTRRTLTLPGGRQTVVPVPAGAYNGQVIRLEAMGETSSSGGSPGALILTILIKQPEESRPTLQPGSTEKTTLASNPNLLNPTTPAAPPEAQRPTVPRTPSRPIDPTVLASSQKPPIVAPPPTNLGGRQGVTSVRRRRALSRGKAILIGLVLLIIMIIITPLSIFYFRSYNLLQRNNLLNAGLQNPYPPYTGTLALNDPLSDNSLGYFWDENSSCQFGLNGTYHVKIAEQQQFYYCGTSTTFSNFAYEVRMRILNGDCGGITFRADPTTNSEYYFRICTGGSYVLYVYTDTSIQPLASGNHPAINAVQTEENLVAVVANGNTITLYVNNQQITSLSDSTNSQGKIGVAANDIDNPTEVEFRDARVWMW
jgi:hypothetical protein